MVSMDGPLSVFAKGTRGHTGRDYFDWNGKTWCVRFESFEEELRKTLTTHDLLVDNQAKTAADNNDDSTTQAFTAILDHLRADRLRREAGWKLEKTLNGVHAVFDLHRMRKLRGEKIGGFASFYMEVNGV
jgi:hypothetical protein